jgi:cytochrome P450
VIPKTAFNERLYHFKKSVQWVHRRLGMETDRQDFMSYVLETNKQNMMTIDEIEATFSTLVIAGSETSSTVLTSTTLNLMLQPDKMAKLSQEIRSSFKDETEINSKSVGRMPYLNAVFQENYRFSPPVPCSIPRVVPVGGDTIGQETYPGNVSHSIAIT